MKKLAAAALALLLVLGTLPAQAADVADLFPAVQEYTGFADVPQGEWYTASVQICYETGLLSGTGSGFSPAGTVSIAEAATLAARMHDILNGGTGIFAASSAGEAWYSAAIKYVEDLGVTGIVDPEANATRQDFFLLLSAAVGDDLLAPINAITTLPDTSNADVLAFYNAGILTGTDAYGTFNGGGTLTRAEMATMAARIVRPVLRTAFVPAQKPAVGGDDTVFATLNGQDITRDLFVAALEREFAAIDFEIDWNTDYGVGDLNEYFRDVAISSILYDVLAMQIADLSGLSYSSLEEAHQGIMNALVGEALRAKHILFSTVDEYGIPLSAEMQAGALQKAELILEVLQYTPTEAQMDQLMGQSDDPGSTYYPNGYVFGTGEMVTEFEEAVLALPIDGISGIVQSQFGYHIIMRLDPQGDPDGLLEFVQERENTLINQVFQQSDFTTTTAFDTFDCQAHYANWLANRY